MKSRIHVRVQQSAKLRITIPVTPSPTQYQIELAVFYRGPAIPHDRCQLQAIQATW